MVILSSAIVLFAATLSTAVALLHDPGPGCVEVLASDRSGSSNRPQLERQRVAEAQAVLKKAESCDFVVVAKIKSGFGKHSFWVNRINVEGGSFLNRAQQTKENVSKATKRIELYFSHDAGGLTSYYTFLHELSDQLEALPQEMRVRVWLFGDAIDTVDPVDMRRDDFMRAGPSKIIERLTLPNCEEWSTSFVGVNRNVRGGVRTPPAQRAEIFWRSLISACGGNVISYAPTVP